MFLQMDGRRIYCSVLPTYSLFVDSRSLDRLVTLYGQVGCRDGPRSELDDALQRAGPPPEGVSAVWVMAADEVLCAHCHLIVDLGTKLRDFLEQCAPAWESEIERERRRLNGEPRETFTCVCLKGH